MKKVIIALTLMALASPVLAESKNMKEIGARLVAGATKGNHLLEIVELREVLEKTRGVNQLKDPKSVRGSIKITAWYARKGEDGYMQKSLDMDIKDEGFEDLNVALENTIRELGAKLVEHE
jgi:hypothetical protein